MCGLCGVLAGADHWSDAEDNAAATTRTQRHQMRNRVANAVLGHYGLKLTALAGGSSLLQSRTGQTALVPHLGALWPAAERLAGRSCDPLDPGLIAALSRLGESAGV